MEDMTRCALCDRPAVVKPQLDSLLCKEHDDERLAAASFDRIWTGSGLTFDNVKRFSQPNFIKRVLDERG